MNDNAMSDEIFAIIVFGIIILVAIVVFSCFDFGFDSGAGSQTGYISEVDHHGLFWQPTAVRLISIMPTYSESDTAWHYGIKDQEIATVAQQAMKDHKKVTVYYETHFFVWSWDYAYRSVITKIEVEG